MVDHEFIPQTAGSTYCGACRKRVDAPEHNYRFPSDSRTVPQSDLPIADDVLEYMEYDAAEDRQLDAEVFGD